MNECSAVIFFISLCIFILIRGLIPGIQSYEALAYNKSLAPFALILLKVNCWLPDEALPGMISFGFMNPDTKTNSGYIG
jgi:hypothetical protein